VTDTPDISTALHEAGHVVVRFALGRACVYASAAPTDDYEGVAGGRTLPLTLGWTGGPTYWALSDRERVALEDGVVIALAGPIAEVKHGGGRRAALVEPARISDLAQWSTDDKTALGYVQRLTHSEEPGALNRRLRELHAEAEQLVNSHWSLITALAEDLVSRGEMAGREIEETIYRAAGRR